MKRTLFLTLAISLTGLVGSAESAQKVKLKPFFAFYGPENPCGNDGLVAFVSTKLDADTKKQARKVSKKYAPRGKGTMTVAGMTYTLTPDRKSDSYDTTFASWSFKAVKSASTAVENQRATLTYDTNAGEVTVSGRVKPGPCA